jgi:hypothetical protein
MVVTRDSWLRGFRGAAHVTLAIKAGVVVSGTYLLRYLTKKSWTLVGMVARGVFVATGATVAGGQDPVVCFVACLGESMYREHLAPEARSGCHLCTRG